MQGLDRKLVKHCLPLKEVFRLFKQPPKRMLAEVTLKVKEKVERMMKAELIRMVRYVEWISNVVPVIKKN